MPKENSDKKSNDVEKIILEIKNIISKRDYKWQVKSYQTSKVYSTYIDKIDKVDKKSITKEQEEILGLLREQLVILNSEKYLKQKNILKCSKKFNSNKPKAKEAIEFYKKFNKLYTRSKMLEKYNYNPEKKKRYEIISNTYRSGYSQQTILHYSELDRKIADIDLKINQDIISLSDKEFEDKIIKPIKEDEKRKEYYDQKSKILTNRLLRLNDALNKAEPKDDKSNIYNDFKKKINSKINIIYGDNLEEKYGLIDSLLHFINYPDDNYKKLLDLLEKKDKNIINFANDFDFFINILKNNSIPNKLKYIKEDNFTKDDLLSLASESKWLTDTNMISYIRSVTEGSNKFSTENVTSQCLRLTNENDLTPILNGSIRYGAQNNSFKDEIESGKVILLPLHFGEGTKWGLVAIYKNKDEYKFDIYDSHQNIDDNKSSAQAIVDKFAKALNVKYSINNKSIFKQMNSHDCGVFAAMTAKLLIDYENNIPLNGVSTNNRIEVDIFRFRKHMLDTAANDPSCKNVKINLDKLLRSKGEYITISGYDLKKCPYVYFYKDCLENTSVSKEYISKKVPLNKSEDIEVINNINDKNEIMNLKSVKNIKPNNVHNNTGEDKNNLINTKKVDKKKNVNKKYIKQKVLGENNSTYNYKT